MITYFPEIYPGELLYSVLARCHKHIGVRGPGRMMELLVGRREAQASFDLPNGLAALAERVGGAIDVDTAIDEATLYPYYTAFVPARLRKEVRAGMATRGRYMHMRLGLSVYRVCRVPRMRFCPACAGDMRSRHGELYWRRDHQLPSVLVCPDHGCPLRESELALAVRNKHEFVAATGAVCREDSPPVCEAVAPAALAHLHGLALDSAALLRSPPEPRTFLELCLDYRERLAAVGLTRSPCKVNQGRLSEEFRAFYGGALAHVPGALNRDGECIHWLRAMAWNHRKATHPVLHLLFRRFLDARPIEAPPAGAGRRIEAGPASAARSGASSKGTPTRIGARGRRGSSGSGPTPNPWVRRPRRNWPEIDAGYAAKLTASVDELRSRTPPEKVTHAALERSFGGHDWLRRRRKNLPVTMDVLRKAIESTAEFQVRRLRWAIGEFAAKGPLPPAWKVLRAASLPVSLLPMVVAMMEESAPRQQGR